MDWNWDESSHRKGRAGKTGIKKLKDEWVWQPARVGPGQSYGGHQVGELFEDELYPCGFCGGTGEKPKGSKCSVCRGAGTVTVEPPAVKCAYCGGRGEEKPRSNVTCSACKGKGVIHVDTPVETCSHCRGTGKEPTNKLICIKCRGKGVVTVVEEDEECWKPGEDGFIDFDEEERAVGSASGSERDALKVVKELGEADSIAVSRRMRPPISSTYANQLCSALARKGLVLRQGVFYSLTPAGEKAMGSD